MAPHHQGAIEVAKAALQSAKNDQVRKGASDVIGEQERENVGIQAWLKSKGAL